MKRFLFPALVLIVCVPCKSHSVARSHHPLNEKKTAIDSVKAQRNRSESLSEAKNKEEIPAAFRGIDFKNLSYPISFRKRSIRLRNGSYDIASGIGGNTFEFEGTKDLRNYRPGISINE
jgi:hypothetical protein